MIKFIQKNKYFLSIILTFLVCLTTCIALVLLPNTGIANADLQIENDEIAQTYGVGYTFKFSTLNANIDGDSVSVNTAIKKDGKIIANSVNTDSITFSSVGDYQVVYYVYKDGVYYNKIQEFSVDNIPYFDFSSIDNVYKLGDAVEFDINAINGADRFTTNVEILAPDGSVYTDKNFTFKMLGDYKLTVKTVIDEQHYSEVKNIKVLTYDYKDLLYVKEGSAEINLDVDSDTSYMVERNGLSIAPVSGTKLAFANVIDMNKFDKNTNLISFAAFLGGDYGNVNNVYLRLTDVHDVENVVEVEFYGLSDSSQTFMRVNFDAISLGINQYGNPASKYASRISDSPLLNKYHQTVINRYGQKTFLTCAYEPSEKAFYMLGDSNLPEVILDLDNPNHVGVGKEWEGFTTGEVYVEIEFVTATNAKVLVDEIFGQSLSGTVVMDENSPSIMLDYAKNVLPNGFVNKSYKIPNVVSIVDVVEGEIIKSNLKIQVSKIENGIIIDHTNSIVDGYFTPVEKGDYRVEYYCSDSVGNETAKFCYFTVLDGEVSPTVSCDLPETATVGTSIIVPQVSVTGLSEIVSSNVCYYYNDKLLSNLNAGDVLFLDNSGTFKVVYEFTDYVGNVVSDQKQMQLVVSEKAILNVSGVPYTAIQGKSLVLPDFEAYDYNYQPGQSGFKPTRSITVNGQPLDINKRIYEVTEAVGSKLEVVFSAGNTSQTKYIEVIKPTYLSDYFMTDAEKENTADGIVFKTNNDVKVKLANPMYVKNSLGFNAIFQVVSGSVDCATLTLTDFYDINKQVSFKVNILSGTVQINGGSKAYPIDTTSNIILNYNDFSQQLIGCDVIKTYLNGLPFDGFKDMVIVELAFEGGTTNSSIKLTTLNNKALTSDFDNQSNLLPYEDVARPTLIYTAPTNNNGILTVHKAIAWTFFSGAVEVKVRLITPNGVHNEIKDVSAQSDYQLSITEFGSYNARYSVTYSGTVNKTATYEYVDMTPITFTMGNLPKTVKVGQSIGVPNVTVLTGEDVSYKFVVIEADGTSKVYNIGEKISFKAAGKCRIVLVLENSVLVESAYYEIEVRG